MRLQFFIRRLSKRSAPLEAATFKCPLSNGLGSFKCVSINDSYQPEASITALAPALTVF